MDYKSINAQTQAAALRLIAQGFSVFPARINKTGWISKDGVMGHGRRWGNTTKQSLVHKHWHYVTAQRRGVAALGIATGEVINGDGQTLLVIDMDVDPAEGIDGLQAFQDLCQQHAPRGASGKSEFPRTVMAGTPSGGVHFYLALPPGVECKTITNWLPGVDLRGYGGMVLAPPSVTERGAYEFYVGAAPADRTVAQAPGWLINRLPLKLAPQPTAQAVSYGHRPPPLPLNPAWPPTLEADGTNFGPQTLIDDLDWYVPVAPADMVTLLRFMDPDADHNDWVLIGMGIHEYYGEDGLPIWDRWSRGIKTRAKKYRVGECRKRWGTFEAGRHDRVSVGTIIAIIRKYVPDRYAQAFEQRLNRQTGLVSLEHDEGGVL